MASDPAPGLTDDVDRRIVQVLVRDGRAGLAELAEATGLSTSAVHQRVRRLEQRGVIRGYHASVDHVSLGLSLTAFISLTPLDPGDPDDIAERLESVPEVESCYSVAGDHSYVILVRVGSPAALEDLIGRVRSVGHCSTRTTVVLSTPYEGRPPALEPVPGRGSAGAGVTTPSVASAASISGRDMPRR
jgi:Lrp/AsnC family leucine-responsive transcriptional regulator